MTRKLIILDLDGTTLNSKSRITPFTKCIMHQAARKGNIISIMTGRPYRLAKPFYQQLGLKSPIITFNGGWGFIPHQNWPNEYHITFDRKIARDFIRHQKSLGIKLMMAEDGHHLLASQNPSIESNRASLGFFPAHLNSDQKLTAANLTFDPICLAVQTQPNDISKVQAYVQRHYNGIVRSAPWGAHDITEIAAHNVNKLLGIKKLAKYYHIKRRDIIAFGDQMNDRKMIQFVGQGVAIKNAKPKLKAVANDVTEFDHDHDGVARYLKADLAL